MKNREEVICYQSIGGIWMPNSFPGSRIRFMGEKEWQEESPEEGPVDEAVETEASSEADVPVVLTFTSGAGLADDVNMPPREDSEARERGLMLENRQKWPAPGKSGKKAHYWNVATFR